MNYSLVLTFKTSTGEKSSITIDKAKADITKAEITTIMDEIITQGVFVNSKGSDFKEKVSAVITEKKNTEFIF